MTRVTAVARYRVREALGLRRWLVLPPLYLLAAWLAADPLRFDGGDARLPHDGLDTVLYDITDARILVLALGGGMVLLTGDAVYRSHRTGALSYILIRCRRRSTWWLGEILGLTATALGLVVLFAAMAGLAGTIRLGTRTSSRVGLAWVYEPSMDLLPQVYPHSRWVVLAVALILLTAMCVVLGAITMTLSLFLRPQALLPVAGALLIAVALEPTPRGLALHVHPVFTAAWSLYVPASTAATVTEPPLLRPGQGLVVQLAWLGACILVGLWTARRFDPGPR